MIITRGQISTTWDEAKRAELVRMYAAQETYGAIGRALGVTRNAVGSAVRRFEMTREPTGTRPSVTEAMLEARRERKRTADRKYHATHPRVPRRCRPGEIMPPPKDWKRRVAVVEAPLNISLTDIKFHSECVYPVGDNPSEMTYCGRGLGTKKNGDPSSYCQGHHNVAHQ
jgi:hypothetical protein